MLLYLVVVSISLIATPVVFAYRGLIYYILNTSTVISIAVSTRCIPGRLVYGYGLVDIVAIGRGVIYPVILLLLGLVGS